MLSGMFHTTKFMSPKCMFSIIFFKIFHKISSLEGFKNFTTLTLHVSRPKFKFKFLNKRVSPLTRHIIHTGLISFQLIPSRYLLTTDNTCQNYYFCLHSGSKFQKYIPFNLYLYGIYFSI